jgi:hypothetical protein
MAQPSKAKSSSRAAGRYSLLKEGRGIFGDDGAVVRSSPASESTLVYYYPIRRHLLIDLANLRDGAEAIDWFWRQYDETFRLESSRDLAELRNQLRSMWRSSDDAFHSPNFDVESILNKWLAWHPSSPMVGFSEQDSDNTGEQAPETAQSDPHKRAHFEEEEYFGDAPMHSVASGELARNTSQPQEEPFQELDEPDLEEEDFYEEHPYLPFECSTTLRKLVPNVSSVRAMLIQGMFEHWGHFKYCANQNCVAPYFIAKRKDQTVCDAEICKAEKQRQHALKWWNENRAKKSQKKAMSKTTKKGSKRNVTR